MTASSIIPILSPVLIGRTSHLEALTRLIDQALGGSGQTAIISGEAGIGKSRLVAELKNHAARDGFDILQGSCFESDRALPFGPFLDLLQFFCMDHTDAEISAAFGTGAAEILKLVPDLAARLPELTPTPALEPQAEKRRVMNALVKFFTGQGPQMIIIEDLHWSDDISLEFLHYLARRIVSFPVILLLTYRLDETHPILDHFLVDLVRERLALELTLQGLTMAEVDGLLRAIFELDHPVSAAFRQNLYILTEGNPFFIEETLKALTASGNIFFERGHWEHKSLDGRQIPRTIQDSVHRRSEHLSDKARRLLELASVVGRRFDFSLLQELTKLGEQELLLLIKELVAAQLVVEETIDQFAFRHALTREAVYLSLLIRERKKYHELVTETLERIYAGSLDARVSNLAYHAYEAGNWTKALEYSQLAGEKAQALFAPQSSLEQFTRALDAAQHLAAPLTELYHARGQAYETIGNFDKAQADFEQALRSARQTDLKKAEWQALIDLGFLWAGRNYQRAGDYFQEMLDVAHQMNDPATLAHGLNRLGNWHANIGNLDEALRFHQQALDVFENLNDQPGLAETLDLLGMASQINGDLAQGTAHYQRAVQLFYELDDRRGLVSSLATLALCGPSYLHDVSVSPFSLAEAVKNGNRGLKIAREIGWRSGEVYSLFSLSINLGPQGEYQRAFDMLQSALEISQEIEHDQWIIGVHCGLGMLYFEMLSLDLARQNLELAFMLAKETGSSVWIGSVTGFLASVCVAQNDLLRAEAVLNGFLSSNTSTQTQMERLSWCARAELDLARGKPEVALAIIDRLIASDPNITPVIAIPRLWKLRGDALIALKQFDTARSMLQSAQAAAVRQGARGWLWRIHLTLGKVYQMQANGAEADQAYNITRSILTELNDSIQDQTLRDRFWEQALAMLPAQPAVSPRKAEKGEFGGLTVRERQVAARIARGESNREIAVELVVSERTVESHVTNILTKLGLSSRARIAVWAADKGLSKPSK